MAFKAAIDKSAHGEKRFLQRDKATGKSVYLFLQIVPDDVVRAIRKRHSRGVRAEKVGKMPEAEAVERRVESTRAYANAAIVAPGSENFEVEVMTQATADAFAAAIGGGTQLKAGDTVCLDGKWNDEVKDLALSVLGPNFVTRVIELETEMRGFEAELEDEAANSFR